MTAPAPGLPCPCCGCATLPSYCTYDICPVCFWEDDGTTDLEDDVNPNNMCLLDARNLFAAWGAIEPEFVHWTRPPRPEEAPEGTAHRGERPYDRWPTVPVAPGARFGWIGPSTGGWTVRDGFLLLDDGRRAGLRFHAGAATASPRVQPADHVGADRDACLEVFLPLESAATELVLPMLRGGLAAAVVALVPDSPAGTVPA